MFFSEADLEAAGVMWQEVCEFKNAVTLNHVIEFKWRPETMKSFFDVQGSATNSSLVKITVESADGDSDLDDDLKFRINLNPEENPDTPSLSLHRMSIQLVGGKTSNPILSSLGNKLAFRNNSVVSASGGTDSEFSG